MIKVSDASRLNDILGLVLEIAGGNYSARLASTDRGDEIDAVAVGMNLMAESLELERGRREVAELLLRDEEHAYDEAPAMFCSLDSHSFEIIKCNRALASCVGESKEGLLGRRLLNFFAGDERAGGQLTLEAIANGGPPPKTLYNLINQDGTQIPVLLSGSRAGEANERIRVILRDISVERSLEEQLLMAQKLEVVGRLASGIAHDFNNILTVILSATSLLKKRMSDTYDGSRELNAILAAVESGAGVTEQLLTLGKPNPEPTSKSSNFNTLVRDAHTLLLRSLGPAAELELDLCPEVLPTKIQAGHLVQVLLNLTINARDAMSGRGRVRIHTHLDTESSLAILDVEDTGAGMSPELSKRIFEPFFTTKAATGGSGLGLAMCQRMVEQWGGNIEVASTLGSGTRIRILLPLVEAPVEPLDAPRSGRDVSILLVDDDALVREVFAEALKDDGYEVLVAKNGREAIALVEQKMPDLVISDVVMPELGGVDLCRALWEKHPTLKVIFMSGYADDALDEEILSRAQVRFIAKPFALDSLQLEVESLLSA